MAFSKSLQKGQFPKVCDVCEVDTKIDWKCLNCNLLMCTKCKDKIHPKFQSTEEHNVVNIKEVGTHPRQLNFSNIKCKIHAKHNCWMFCKTCDSIVCPQCISQVHNVHVLAEISEAYEVKVAKLKELKKQIKKDTTELTNEKTKMDNTLESGNSKYNDMKSRLLLQEKTLKENVHSLTCTLLKELDDQWKLTQFTGKKGKDNIDSLTERLNDENNKIEELICSDDPKRLLTKSSEEFTKTLEEIMTREILEFQPFPDFVSGVVTSKNIGSFHRKKQVSVTNQFDTALSRIVCLSICPDERLWISDGSVIIKASSYKNMTMKNLLKITCSNANFAVTRTGDLLIASSNMCELEQMDKTTGQVTRSGITVTPFECTAVHVAGDTVIVGTSYCEDKFATSGNRAVILINMKTKNETTLKYGGNNERLFTHISDICTTKCGDVCVVDLLSSELKGRVLFLNPEDRSRPINVYNGHPKISDEMKLFMPSSIVSTPMDNIIVSESEHNALHVLNSYGNLVQYIDTVEIGLQNPSSLAMTHRGCLYVGCAGHDDDEYKAKIFELDISGF